MKVFANANRLKILIYLSYFHIYKSIAKRYHHYAFCISALCIFVVRQYDKYEFAIDKNKKLMHRT